MIDLLKLLGGLLVGVFRSHAAREAEMAFLRQKLVVLQRSAPARLRLRTKDRLIFVWLYRLFPCLLEAAVVFKPETLVRWHRSGFRLYWRWESRHRAGRPVVPADIRDLIRTISRDNPLWRAPRIHGELLKLGIDIAQSTLAVSPLPYDKIAVEVLNLTISRGCFVCPAGRRAGSVPEDSP